MIYTCTWVYKVPITRICSNILLTTILMYLWFHSTIPYLMKWRYPLINRGVIIEWQMRVRHGRTRVIQWKIIKIVAKPDFPFKLLGIMRDPLSETYCSSLYTKSFFFQLNIKNAIVVSSSFDSGQTQPFVGPDFGPNCFQWLSTDVTSR